ncbi:MAG: ATP-binding cassette domain-containing protein [bacterium]|nr:ATP-binding cassette domain-containing protein [bacterium]
MEGAFIELRHVHASYHEPVLKDISFSLDHGSHIAVFGHSTSGKTTLLKLLSGAIKPDFGSVIVNGTNPDATPSNNAGYVSVESNDLAHETVHDVLHDFGLEQGIQNLPAKIGEITQVLGIHHVMQKNIQHLSTTEKVRVKLAKAALSEAPILLFDDVADVVGAAEMKALLATIFLGRTVCIATRSVAVAEALQIPILLLHKLCMVSMGTKNEIAHATGTSRVVDAWVEGMRYDLLRKLRSHPGVLEVRLIPTDQLDGTCIRITIRNSRYLPALYDALSQAPLINIQELPVAFDDILKSLS